MQVASCGQQDQEMWLLTNLQLCANETSFNPTNWISYDPPFFFGSVFVFWEKEEGGEARALGASDPRAWVYFMRGNCHLVQASMCL